MKDPAKEICKNVDKKIRPQALTLTRAVLAMQAKVEQQIPIYEKMPLAQQVTVGTGEKLLRQNPAVVEFRATVRDYAAALNSLNDIVEENKQSQPAAVSSLDDLRSKFKIG